MGFGKTREERVIARLQTRVNALMCLYPSHKESNHCIARQSKYFPSCHANIFRSLTTAIDVDSCRHRSTGIHD